MSIERLAGGFYRRWPSTPGHRHGRQALRGSVYVPPVSVASVVARLKLCLARSGRGSPRANGDRKVGFFQFRPQGRSATRVLNQLTCRPKVLGAEPPTALRRRGIANTLRDQNETPSLVTRQPGQFLA